MTTSERAAAREVIAALPAGPWSTNNEYPHSRHDNCTSLLDASGKRLADTLNVDCGQVTMNEESQEYGVCFYETGSAVDALNFAVFARTALPASLDALDKAEAESASKDAEIADLRAELERWRKALEQIGGLDGISTVPEEFREYWRSQVSPHSNAGIAIAALSPAQPKPEAPEKGVDDAD